MRDYYIGITIGPIIETLSCASRPAALWCASSMFSCLAEDLCSGLIKKGGKIISPYYPEERDAKDYSVVSEKNGKYHDRIFCIIKAESSDDAKSLAQEVVCQSKENLAEVLTVPFADRMNSEQLGSAIMQYLQIHFIVEEKSSEAADNLQSSDIQTALLCLTSLSN